MATGSTQPWDRPDLIRRVVKALDFALLKIEALSRGGTGALAGAATTGHRDWQARQKALAETAVLLWCAAQVRDADSGIDERLEAAAAGLAPMARGEDVLSAICADPGQADGYSVAHIILRRMGFPDGGFDEVLSASWPSRAAFEPEQTPFRGLERAWLARMLGRSTSRGGPLVAASMLARPMDIFAASTHDYYAFTHALMFASDFGLSRPRLPRPARSILIDADAALAAGLEANDLDLAAELSLSWPLLGKSWSATATFAFGLLADVEDREGFLPVLGFDLARHRTLSPAERAGNVISHSYHSTYVMGILCATALRRGLAPPAAPPFTRKAAAKGAAAALLRLLDQSAAPACWESNFRALAPRQQGGLAAFVLAALLHRAGKRGDLAQVRGTLQIALDFGLVSAVPSQAASLLRRCQRFEQARLREVRQGSSVLPVRATAAQAAA